MSFILDALKKSENDRQRQTGPALFEVKVAQPKAGFPVWAIAIVALLAVNMVIVGWLLLRRSSRSDEGAAQNTQPPVASQPAPTQGPNSGTWSPSVTTLPPPANAQQGYSQQPGAQQNQSAANMSRGEADGQSQGRMGDRDQREPTLGGAGGGNGAAGPGNYGGGFGANGEGAGGALGANGTGGGGANGGRTGAPGSRDASAAAANGSSGAEGNGGNPDDYAPAQDPESSLFKGHVKRGTASGLMLYQDLAVANGSNLPELRLDLHVYAPKPENRFALINMQRMREGDSIKDVRVEAITPEGVVLSHNGTKFLLPRE